MALMEITVSPVGTATTSVSKYVASCHKLLECQDRVKYQLTSMGTILEGNLEDLFQIAKELHEVPFKEGIKRVGTVIRIDDRINRGSIDFSGVHTLVLDEADEMLDMGFMDDIKAILQKCPSERQTMLFSATIPKPIQDLAKRFMKDPVTVRVEGVGVTAPLIDQWFYEVNNHQKLEALCRIMDVENPNPGIIFCRTKKGADELAKELTQRGYLTEALHGDLSQRERDYSMSKLRQGLIEILVATDVAARGLDISDVSHVINYDIPQDADSYVHRIGRTGRAGREGTAITLTTPREVKQLRFIEKSTKAKIPRRELPTLEDARVKRDVLLTRRLKDALEAPAPEYKQLASSLLDDYDSTTLVAAALSLLANEERPLTDASFASPEVYKRKIRLPFGRTQGFNVKGLIQHLISNYKIAFEEIGRIKLLDDFSTVELPEYIADDIESKMGKRQGKPKPKKYNDRFSKRPSR